MYYTHVYRYMLISICLYNNFIFFQYKRMNAKVESQEIPRVTGKFSLGVQNEAGKRVTEFCQENTLVIHLLPTTQEKTLHIDITRWSVLKSD